jgi:hypothetical protein
MKSLPELLRDADPIGYEPRRTDQDRRNSRQRVLAAPHAGPSAAGRRRVIVAAAALLALAGGGFRYWSLGADVVAAVRFEVRLAEESPGDGLREAVITGSGQTIYLHGEAVLTNGDIARARAVENQSTGTYSVAVTFKEEGAAKILRASQGHIGKPIALLVNGAVVVAPVIRSPISNAAVISGDYSKAEADTIVAGLLGL